MEYVMIDGTIVNVHRHAQGAKEGLKDRKALICISQRPQRKEPLRIDLELYKARHLIENFLGKLKEFKRIAMRSDKTDESFKAMIYACSVIINAR